MKILLYAEFIEKKYVHYVTQETWLPRNLSTKS